MNGKLKRAVALLLAVVLVIALLASMILPSFFSSRRNVKVPAARSSPSSPVTRASSTEMLLPCWSSWASAVSLSPVLALRRKLNEQLMVTHTVP